MKYLLTMLMFVLIITGCAQKSAFERFQLTKPQELAEDNMKSNKIINDKNEVVGVVTAVYLNKIDPKRYNHQYEFFYVYLFAKNETATIKFSLDGKQTLLQEELSNINEFTTLTSFTSKWNKYYLVGFAKGEENLHLKVYIDEDSTTLTFRTYR